MISPKIALAAASMLALAGCAQFQQSSRSNVSPAEKAACRTHAENAYAAQNRAEIYRADSYAASNSASPFSTSGNGAAPSARLSSQYAYQRNLDDCYTTGVNPSPDSTPTKP